MQEQRVSGGNSWIKWIMAATTLFALMPSLKAADGEINADDLRPGLITIYTAKDGKNTVSVTRLEPTIALALKAGEAPHPRLAADNGTVRWEGYLNILRPGDYVFHARVDGKFSLTLDSRPVLAAEPRASRFAIVAEKKVKLEAGVYSLVAEFERTQKDAQVELSWQGPQFRREPLTHAMLGHLPAQAPALLARDTRIDRGRFLAEERNCLACHKPATDTPLLKGMQSRHGPDLSNIGDRAYAGWLYRWLEAPQKIRPGAVMPQLFGDDETGRVERHAVAAYLASLGGPLKTLPSTGLKKLVNVTLGEQFFGNLGCLACHRQEAKNVKEEKEASFLPRPATYPLTGLGSKTTPERLAAYLTNPLATDPSGRMPHMLLQGNEAPELARFLCASRDDTITTGLPEMPAKEKLLDVFQQVETRAEKQTSFQHLPGPVQLIVLGNRLVIEKGCNNCHTIAPGGKPFASVYAKTSFEEIGKESAQQSSCFASEPSKRGNAPWFNFNKGERKALKLFLKEGASGPGSPAPAFAARVMLQRFNCLACHTRDGEGGLDADLIGELRKYEKAENSEAVSPPTLTGVAHKLHTSTLRQVLVGANRVRPWMGLRMPQFGEANVGKLPPALASLEGIEPDDQVHKTGLTVAKLEAGKQLIGKGGFGCISCHDLAGVPNSGTRGPDLALTTQRVRYDWNLRWLEQPQRMQPGTRMPSVFSGGKSLVDHVLGGKADAQADAMWAYLSLGPGMPLPDGLEPPKGLILAVKEKPFLLRTFMPDAGARAIAVGYPNGVSLSFDAETCRLAYGWSGSFLDASPVWNDRGGSPAKVLGQRFWTAPPGCPWGVNYSNEPPNFAALAHDPAYGAPLAEGKLYDGARQIRFDGYSVDKAGLPTFRYCVNAADPEPVKVSERPEPLRSPAGVGVARRFTLEVAAKQSAWLLAGETSGEPRVLNAKGVTVPADLKSGMVEFPADRVFVLPQDGDRALVLTPLAIPEGSHWQLRQQDKKWQVLLRLPAAKEPGKVAVGINVWSLYRDEPALLKELFPVK